MLKRFKKSKLRELELESFDGEFCFCAHFGVWLSVIEAISTLSSPLFPNGSERSSSSEGWQFECR